MKSRLMSASTTLTEHPGNQDSVAEALAQPLAIGDRAGRAREAHARPQLTLAGVPTWKHKLILTGRLDRCTVVELEEEIECLCEEGVKVLTVDLGRLDAIDSVGARAIACGGATCRRRGRDFAVVPGSPIVHRALVEVGAEGWFVGDAIEPGALPLAATASDGSSRDTSTVMVKNL